MNETHKPNIMQGSVNGPSVSADCGESLRSKNPLLRDQYEKVVKAARSELPILVLGPSGSGKECVARTIHQHSSRSQGPFVTINCSSLVESLAESELFGHTRGSFTGASHDRKGAFEFARRGTLFLDEVGDLPYPLQAKLLRALENREIRPVGSDRNIETDVRILAATHQNLLGKIETNQFRADLFYRLNVIQVKTLALQDRMEDFDDIVFELAKKFRARLSYGAIDCLRRQPWPGNIRELQNMVARIAAFYPDELVNEDMLHLLLDQLSPSVPVASGQPISQLPRYRDQERKLIIESLKKNFGNQRRAAADLGMPKSTLHDRLKTYSIDPREFSPLASRFQDHRFYPDGLQLT